MYHKATPSPGLSRAGFYAELAGQLSGLTAGERNWIANAANCAALLFDALPDLNWAGFYLIEFAAAAIRSACSSSIAASRPSRRMRSLGSVPL